MRFTIQELLRQQREFSLKAFGPGRRTVGIIKHIKKELVEVEADPYDLSEWVDVAILAMDGYLRHGGAPELFLSALLLS